MFILAWNFVLWVTGGKINNNVFNGTILGLFSNMRYKSIFEYEKSYPKYKYNLIKRFKMVY